MPTIEENRQAWDKDWDDPGDSWSQAWGGVRSQWFGTILPRLQPFLPAATILELGPGFGRWTHFLREQCRHLVLVDLADKCIQACRRRFDGYSGISYYTNDGKSLAMIPDRSISLVFSFDSLVHADADVVEAYISELARKLTPHGVGLIHHSNLGSYVSDSTGALAEGVTNQHWRSENMSARLFEEYCENAGLQCIGQEVINWGGEILNDCFSLFTPRDSPWKRPNRVVHNKRFMEEAARLRLISELYQTRR